MRAVHGRVIDGAGRGRVGNHAARAARRSGASGFAKPTAGATSATPATSAARSMPRLAATSPPIESPTTAARPAFRRRSSSAARGVGVPSRARSRRAGRADACRGRAAWACGRAGPRGSSVGTSPFTVSRLDVYPCSSSTPSAWDAATLISYLKVSSMAPVVSPASVELSLMFTCWIDALDRRAVAQDAAGEHSGAHPRLVADDAVAHHRVGDD